MPSEAQSPARIVPMLRAYGTGAGWVSLISRSSARSGSMSRSEASIGLSPPLASAACRPSASTVTSNQLMPAPPSSSSRPVHSGEQHGVGQHARTGGGQGAVAGALLLDDPDHRERAGERVGVGLEQRLDGQGAIAKPDFMSPAPRPCIHPSEVTG